MVRKDILDIVGNCPRLVMKRCNCLEEATICVLIPGWMTISWCCSSSAYYVGYLTQNLNALLCLLVIVIGGVRNFTNRINIHCKLWITVWIFQEVVSGGLV